MLPLLLFELSVVLLLRARRFIYNFGLLKHQIVKHSLELSCSGWLAYNLIHPAIKSSVDIPLLTVSGDSNNLWLLPLKLPVKSEERRLSRLQLDLRINEVSDLLCGSGTVLKWHVAVHKDDIEHITVAPLLDSFDGLLTVDGSNNLLFNINVAHS